ncbi:SnodProt1 [Thelephora terrestris]|uniref:SnodProt1 n=1 Tax=Thelephora terrestris TaxID=56493 RepID=A0A9P6H8N3_9AGAM|nr:SnodProt1 [Thelephora terrestris]
MKFFSVIAILVAPLIISATSVTYDTVYDQATDSLDNVACSNGPNGLLTKGYKVFGDIPTFPNISGSSVAYWNSPNCGSCWNITYQGETITVTVIDYAGDGFNLSEEAMNTLTGGEAVELGVVDATSVQVDESFCGMA